MTECITKQLIFSFFQKRQLTADFEGGEITSDPGLLLIRQADDSLRLTEKIAGCMKTVVTVGMLITAWWNCCGRESIR